MSPADRDPIGAIPAPTDAPPRDQLHHCANCGTAAPGKFCPECGQETRVALPTAREIMRDATGRVVAWDGRTWRTLYVLLFRPGMLTAEYLRGRRKRYVRPSRLFFVSALVLFATIKLFGQQAKVITVSTSPEGAKAAKGAPTRDGAVPALQRNFANDVQIDVRPSFDSIAGGIDRYFPTDIRQHVARFKALPPSDQSAQIYSGVLRYGPYAMVALLPLFALLQKLTYFRRSRRYPHRPSRYVEHLVFGAHLHAFAFLMLIPLVITDSALVEIALAAWILIYVGRARKKVYGGVWWTGFLRSLPAGFAYLVLLAITMVALVAISIAL